MSLSAKKAELSKLYSTLDDLKYRYAVLNGGTQQHFTLSMKGLDFNIEYMDRGYMQTLRPHYVRLRSVLQAAISDEMLEVEEYILIVKGEIKQLLLEEAASYV